MGVKTAQEPVGEGQHLTSGVAAECCEHHGTADEEERCVAGDGEGGRIPPVEVKGQGSATLSAKRSRAGVVERCRVAANVPPVPGQHESGEADEAE